MKNLKKVIFALMVVFLVVGFIGCKTESDPPKAEVEKWTVVYGEDSLKEGTYAELEDYAEKVGLDETTDYTVDKTNKKIILTDSGMSKVTAYEGNNAGNDDNNDEENGSGTGGNTGNDNPGNTETPVVTNNFKGNVFVAEYSVESYSEIWGYIEFIDDTNGKMGISKYDEGNPIITEQPFTYSVTDDVATLNATMDGMEITVTTSKLTDGIFTFSTEDVDKKTGETYSILVTCTKGDKSFFDVWTVRYEEQDLKKDFFYEFEDYVELLVEGDDYSKDDTTKTITLTADGWDKVQDAMGGGSEDEEGGEVTGETWTVMYDGNTVEKFESFEEAETFASSIGLVEDDDYTKNDATKTITLTADGWAKVQAAMGGGSGEEGGEVTGWTVMYNGNTVQTFDSFEEAETFASKFGLEEKDDYTVNKETQIITLTDAGAEKVQDAMGGGSEEEGGEVTGEEWTVMYDGDTVKTFASLEEAEAYAEENGLTSDDYTVNKETHTITLKVYYYYYHDGKLIGGKNTLEDFQYEVEDYDLLEVTDYTIDHENKQINFTDSGMLKSGYAELEG